MIENNTLVRQNAKQQRHHTLFHQREKNQNDLLERTGYLFTLKKHTNLATSISTSKSHCKLSNAVATKQAKVPGLKLIII
jgi:hypothetical protein